MPQPKPFEISQEYVEKLFAHVYMDLGQRTEARDDFRLYHQLNMARLVRQLLVDGTGLFNLANRYHKHPVRFVLAEIGPAPADIEAIPAIYSGTTRDRSDFPPGFYLHPYKIDGYLASSPMTLADRRFTILEIVKYVANEFGGVHLSPYLKEEDDQLLARFNDSLTVGGNGVALNRIDQIARTTLHALAPLMKTVQAKYDAIAQPKYAGHASP